MQTVSSRDYGYYGEDMAIEYLQEQGLTILDRNIYSPHGEVDIMAYDEKEESLVAVEVKYWDFPVESLEYAINPTKQRRIIKTTQHYMAKLQREQLRATEEPSKEQLHKYLRFDVIHIDRDTGHITHLEGAFDGGCLA